METRKQKFSIYVYTCIRRICVYTYIPNYTNISLYNIFVSIVSNSL
nr:MAG TPA: hypothetical protein [Caudoviricetes sp.]